MAIEEINNIEETNNTQNIRITRRPRGQYFNIGEETKRILIRSVFEDGKSIKQTASDLRINYNTAKSVIKKAKEDHNYANSMESTEIPPINVFNNVGRPKIITEEIKSYIEILIEWTPSITLGQIKAKIESAYNVTLSISSIFYTINDLRITLKDSRKILERVNAEDTIQRRFEYASFFLENAPEDKNKCIFIDESGFNLHLRRRKARSRVGERASLTIPAVRGRNVSLIIAANQTEVIHYEIITEGTVNTLIFKRFLDNLLEKLQTNIYYDNSWLIMDNARIHHTEIVREVFQNQNYVLHFLSPYSFMLNPVENIFSKIKAIVRRILSNNENAITLSGAITEGVNSITPADCSGYMVNMMRNISLALMRHVFLN